MGVEMNGTPVDLARPTRDSIRASILASHKPSSKVITFFGEEIEIRQPSLEDIIKAADPGIEGNQQVVVVRTLTKYAFVPGTNERLFDDADAEQLLTMPFGGDFVRVQRAFEELTGTDFKAGRVG